MKKARWISAAIGTAVLTAGFALPATAAFASGPDGDGGVLSVLSAASASAPPRWWPLAVAVATTRNCSASSDTVGGSPAGEPPTVVSGQKVRTGRMIRLRRVAFLLPSALIRSLDSSQSPYSA